MRTILLIALLGASACSTGAHFQQGQAVDAVMTRNHSQMLIDADPVAARAASFGEIKHVENVGPYVDRLPEQHDPATRAKVQMAAPGTDLSFDAADVDPLATRNWR